MYRVSDAPVVHFLYFTRIKVVASFNRDSTYDRKNSEQRKKKKTSAMEETTERNWQQWRTAARGH